MALALPSNMKDCDAVERQPENLRRAECMAPRSARVGISRAPQSAGEGLHPRQPSGLTSSPANDPDPLSIG